MFSRKTWLVLILLAFFVKPLYAQHALMEAYTQSVRDGNVADAKSYFDMGVSVDYVNDEDKKTPLLIACCRPDNSKKIVCDLPMIKMLVENGANVNAQTPDGRSALMLLCEVPSSDSNVPEAALYLAGHGANIKGMDHRKRTVLSYACCTIGHSCSPAMVQYMLEKGSYPNTTDTAKQTPLMWLAQCKPNAENTCIQAVQMIKAKGANLKLRDKHGKTARQIAEKHGLKKLAKEL